MGSMTRKRKKLQHQRSHGETSVVERITELRRLIVEAPDLSDVAEHFFERLGQDQEFLNAGGKAENDRLIAMARVALNTYFENTVPQDKVLFYIPSEKMWHGAVVFQNGVLVQLIHFDDVNRGVCFVAGQHGEVTHHFRFSIPDNMPTDLDPYSIKLVAHPRKQPGPSN